MKRTEILCPNCLRKKLLHDNRDGQTWCDQCGQEYVLVNETTVKFK